MKRRAAAVMVASAVALLLSQAFPAPAAAAPENLLENGGFEKGLDGWTVNDESGTTKATLDPKIRAEGKQAAYLVTSSSGGNCNDRLQAELRRIPAGKKVVVSAKLRGKDLKNCWLKFLVYDAKGESIEENCDLGRFSGTFDWRDVDRKFTLAKEAVRAELRICMFQGGEVWVDDVRVVGDAAAAKDRNAATTGDAAKPLDLDLKKWLDKNAVQVKTLDAKAPFDDLRPLQEILKDATIVQLGETTHGDGACIAAKARLVRFLHEEMGFEVLVFESGLWECDRANALLRNGDADGAMSSSIFPIFHAKPVRGLFRYLAEQAKTPKPLVLAGFDCQRTTGEAYRFLEDLGTFLAPIGGPADGDIAALDRLQALMWAGGGYAPSEAERKAGLDARARLRKAIDDGRAKLVEKHGEAEVALLSRALDNWRDNEALAVANADKSLAEWTAFNLRDASMASNLRWLAETRYAGKKIITWGATMHLAHGVDGVRAGKPDHFKGCANMGGAVHAALGRQVYTIGFAAHGGQCGTVFAAQPAPLGAPKPDSVEDLLHRFGAPFLFVDLRRDGPFAKPMRMATMSYDREMQAAWPTVMDAVFFIDEMTRASR